MDYNETIAYLFSQLPMFQRVGSKAYKSDLGNIVRLCELLGNPQNKFKSIHIGGTNGKGSVSHLISSVFIEKGFKVGTYTSPHYINFRERIRINGHYIAEQQVVKFVSLLKDEINRVTASFFEITVAMAFWLFAEEEVDFAVIEVGLGGRLDSTNIISPLVSVITNISKDHQQYLGTTFQAIAKEKAGIIKKNTPIVIGRTQVETVDVFMETAEKQQADIYFADQLYSIQDCTGTNNHYLRNLLITQKSGEKISCETSLQGNYQLENIRTAFAVFDLLKEQYALKNDHFKRGVHKVQENSPIMGRWQILQHKPLIVADSCHNEDGIYQFLKQLKAMNANHLHLIYGAVNDKDVSTITQFLPENATYYLTEPSIPRKMPVHQLKKFFSNYHSVYTYPHVSEALTTAKKQAKPEDIIAIFGSIFLIADVLENA